jgi:YVTN family beta-propeller protein
MRSCISFAPVAIVACLFGCLQASAAAEDQTLATHVRRPVALALSPEGKWLYVANRDSGTVSTIDVEQRTVVAETEVGQRLSDLVAVPGTSRLLAADEQAHEIVLLDVSGDDLNVQHRLPVSPYPVTIQVMPGGKMATVTSLWSRRLSFVELDGEPKVATVLDLPFAPRCQTLLAEHNRLIVADSFGGKLALVDPTLRKLVAEREFPGHNVRGLGVSADGRMLLVAHQMLNDLAHSIRNDIHWGLLMSNDLRWLRVDSVLAGGKQLYHGGHMHPLGEANRGGGDPGGIAVAADGTVVVAISGVSELAIGREEDFAMQRLHLPDRPTDVCISADGQLAFVASTFDDSVSIVDVPKRKLLETVSLGPAPELSQAQQGERLFYDARLSHDGWMSCHSCHTDGHANGQKNDNFSDRSFGAPKRVLSLLGVKDTLPLAWNGQVKTLERQIDNSVHNTMQREETLPRDQVQAIAAYLKTLELPPPLAALRGDADDAAIERGRLVFEDRDCASCHAPPNYTTPRVYDVGLADSQGVREFNPPSLRGLSHRGSLLHDSRAKSLEEVFLEHKHPSDSEWTAEEVQNLAAFLRSL